MNTSAAHSAISAFADELRRAREYKRVTAAEIAGKTRIRSDYLQSIETGDWDQVPSAYLRGYVSLYAQAVGMNRDKVLQEFDALLAEETGQVRVQVESDAPLLKGPQHVELTRSKIRMEWFAALSRKRWLAYLVSGGLIVAGYYGIRLTHLAESEEVQVNGLDAALSESLVHLHNSRTTISDSLVSIGKVSSGKRVPAILVAMQKCEVAVSLISGVVRKNELFAYDTLYFEDAADLIISVQPANSALMFNNDNIPIASTRLSGNSTVFDFTNSDTATFAQANDILDTASAQENHR